MDIIDTAAEIEELQRNAALSAHRIDRNAVPGCQTCASCQEERELKNKQRGIQ